MKHILKTITAAYLQKAELPEVKHVIPGIITEGLTLLCADPKARKSIAATDMALAVASGTHALGDRRPIQSDVLYLSLEDNDRAYNARLKRLAPDQQWPETLHIAFKATTVDKGLKQALEEFIDQHPTIQMIIVDTIKCVRPAAKAGNVYEYDYDTIRPLQDLAAERGIAIVAIHHNNKGDHEMAHRRISGSQGLLAAADAVIIIEETDDPNVQKWHYRGRHMQDWTKTARWDPETWKTTLEDAAEKQPLTTNTTRDKILAIISHNPATAKDVATLANISLENAINHLRRLQTQNLIVKNHDGTWKTAVSNQVHNEINRLDLN